MNAFHNKHGVQRNVNGKWSNILELKIKGFKEFKDLELKSWRISELKLKNPRVSGLELKNWRISELKMKNLRITEVESKNSRTTKLQNIQLSDIIFVLHLQERMKMHKKEVNESKTDWKILSWNLLHF